MNKQVENKSVKITLLYLGQTGAGPAFSFEMAKALSTVSCCNLQVVVSKQVSNYHVWEKEFKTSNVKFETVDTYNHNKLSFAFNTIYFVRTKRIIEKIKAFSPDCLYVPFLLSWDFKIYPKLYKQMRIIATLHDPHPHDTTHNPFINWIQRQNKNAYKYVNDVIILNRNDVGFVKEHYCPNVHVIPHASFSYYVKDLNKNNELNNTIGFIGRIEPYKGLDLLVNAFLQLDKKYKLIIAGSGKIDDETLKKIKNNDRIELINRYIEDQEFTELINKMDFVVLPYKRASQSGVIPLVFAHAKPVIATNVGALREQVPEGTGLITDPDVFSLVESIKKMYEKPEEIFLKGGEAKKYADSELTWESSARKLMNIINNGNCNG